MAKLLKLRRGTTSQHSSFTGAEGEVTVDTDKESLVVHNGSTAGGFPIARADGTGVSNFTITGELDAATLDISGNADIDGTLEADAYTVDGTALNEYIADTVGAMVGSNTETGIAVTYEDSDNTLDFAITSIPGVTFTGDVTFDNGTNSGKDIVWDESEDYLNFKDNVHATFGNGSDLRIYHDGSHNILLGVNGADFKIKDASNTSAIFDTSAGVELFYADSKKLETTSSGISVTGSVVPSEHVDLADNKKLLLGTDDDIEFYSSGSHGYLANGTGDLYIKSDALYLKATNNENYLKATADGAVELYHNNVKKFDTKSDGVEIHGHLLTGDANEIRIGNGPDLKLYHSGGNSFVTNATGQLEIRSDTLLLQDNANGHSMFKGVADGTVELYHDNVKTFETHSNGIVILGPEGGSGQIYLYADEGDDDADKWLVNTADGGDFTIQSKSTGSWANELVLTNAGNLTATGNVTAYSDARLKTDIETLDNALDKVTKLRGVSYKRLDTQEAGIGVIAQEIENVLPEVVQDGAYKSVAYGNVVGLLIEAIKELKAQVDEHKVACEAEHKHGGN
jgi:hypothetical protein